MTYTWLFSTLGGALFALGAAEIIRWYRARPKAAEPNELKALVQQERVKQALPLLTMIAMNLPVDVGSVTLTLHYGDESLTLNCGRPQPMGVQP